MADAMPWQAAKRWTSYVVPDRVETSRDPGTPIRGAAGASMPGDAVRPRRHRRARGVLQLEVLLAPVCPVKSVGPDGTVALADLQLEVLLAPVRPGDAVRPRRHRRARGVLQLEVLLAPPGPLLRIRRSGSRIQGAWVRCRAGWRGSRADKRISPSRLTDVTGRGEVLAWGRRSSIERLIEQPPDTDRRVRSLSERRDIERRAGDRWPSAL